MPKLLPSGDEIVQSILADKHERAVQVLDAARMFDDGIATGDLVEAGSLRQVAHFIHNSLRFGPRSARSKAGAYYSSKRGGDDARQAPRRPLRRAAVR